MPILVKQAVELVSQTLHLPLTGYQQEWDVEWADSARIGEFLALYQRDTSLDQPQRYVLMALILASCDEALQTNKSINSTGWKQIKTILRTEPAYQDLIDYWALPGVEDVNEHFHLTPYIRSLD